MANTYIVSLDFYSSKQLTHDGIMLHYFKITITNKFIERFV